VGNKIIDGIKAEPAKWLPIGISALALVISFLGWLEAHRGRLINEQVNRPTVTVEITGKSQVLLLREGLPEILKVVYVTGEIKNLGNMTATITKIDSTLTELGECKLDKPVIGERWSGTLFEGLEGTEVVPRLSLTTSERFRIPPQCEEKKILLIAYGVIYYTDTVSGTPYEQEFIKSVSIPHPTPLPSPSASASP
jgi:hypothetical protein